MKLFMGFQYKEKQRGLAAVEATLVLPLIFLMMLAIAEFGRGIYQYSILTKSLKAGALVMDRMGSYVENPDTRADKENLVKNIVVYGNSSGSGNTVLPGLNKMDLSFSEIYEMPLGSGDYYSQISISYNWQPIFGDSFNAFFSEPISLDFPLDTSIAVRVK